METKKNLTADIRQYRGVFFNIGLIVAICATLVAFEWKTYGDYNTINKGTITDVLPDDVPITRIDPTPPPPPPKPIQIIEIKEDEPIIEELPMIDNEPFAHPNLSMPKIEEPPVETIENEFIVVEQMPSYKGGMVAFYQYLAKKLRYPSNARKLGIQGKVYISFTVNSKGELTDFKVMRGIGGGCDEEALRVLQKSPKWNPGKQRGKPVNVRMTLPITFKLD